MWGWRVVLHHLTQFRSEAPVPSTISSRILHTLFPPNSSSSIFNLLSPIPTVLYIVHFYYWLHPKLPLTPMSQEQSKETYLITAKVFYDCLSISIYIWTVKNSTYRRSISSTNSNLSQLSVTSNIWAVPDWSGTSCRCALTHTVRSWCPIVQRWTQVNLTCKHCGEKHLITKHSQETAYMEFKVTNLVYAMDRLMKTTERTKVYFFSRWSARLSRLWTV